MPDTLELQEKTLDLSIEDVRSVDMVFSQPIASVARPIACCTSTMAIPEEPERE